MYPDVCFFFIKNLNQRCISELDWQVTIIEYKIKDIEGTT